MADAGMYIAKHAGGNQVAASEPFREGSNVQRQLLSSYLEGFLHRGHNGPEHLEELVGTLRKLCSDTEEGKTAGLREALERLGQVHADATAARRRPQHRTPPATTRNPATTPKLSLAD